MTITIPQAQTPFQQAQQPRRRVDEPSVAAAIGDLADVAVAFGVDQKNHERAMQMQTARVTATERLGALRDQYEQDPNLAGLSDRFAQDAATIEAEIVATLPEGRLREQFELDYRQMAGPQGRAIARREYALQRDAGLAQLNAGLRTLSAEAARAPDTESRDAILTTAAAQIGAAKAAGWISAVDEEALLAGTYGEVVQTSAMSSIQQDPQEFLDRLDAGEFDDLDPQQAVRLKGQAERAIAAELTRQARADEAEQNRQAAILADDVGDAIEIIESGLRFDGLDALFERAQGTEHEANLRATVAAAQTESNFTILDPLQQQAVIDEIAAQPTGDPEDVARLNRLRSIRQRTVESITADPLSHVSDRSILEVGSVDLSDPQSVRRRIATAETVMREMPIDQRGSTGQVRYFTNAERDQLRQQIQGANPDAQLAVATQVVSGFGDRAPFVLAEIGGDDPLFQLAGQLVGQTGDIAAARSILTGRQLAAEKNGAKPKAAVRSRLMAQYAEVFPPSDRPRLTALFAAADAHFAATGLSIDPDASDDQLASAYQASLQAVSGGMQHQGSAFGGIQPVRDRLTLLPSSMSAEVVETVLSRATAADLAAASLSGGAPHIGGQTLPDLQSRPARRAGLNQMQIMSIGGGRYLLGVPRSDGSLRWLTDDQSADGLFHLNLEALQSSVMRGAE